MTPEQETQVLAQLYDRLYDAVTYSPPGKSAPSEKGSTFIQMAKNLVLDPADFANMLSPVDPGGSLATAAAFASFCDAQPTNGPLWSDSGGKTSSAYQLIVKGANSSDTVDPKQHDIFQKAFDFLNTTVTTKDFMGNEKSVTSPSDIAVAYDQGEAAYITAVCGYRAAYNGYDLTKVEDQRAWNAVQPGLQLTVDQTWNAWSRSGKAEVEQAQQALASTINDALTAVIKQSQDLVGPQYQLASPDGIGSFLPSYAIPSSWADPASKASHLHFDSANLTQQESTRASSYSASAKGSWGLWSAGGGSSGGSEDQHTHMDSDSFVLDADLVFVQIKRPWLNPLLFSMKDWYVTSIDADGVSNGNIDDPEGIMPLLPTGFVIARNVTIAANFGSEDMKFHEEQTQSQASAGWGPFSISGTYSQSSSNRTFSSAMSGGKLTFEGLQVIAWVSSVVHRCPPEKAPA